MPDEKQNIVINNQVIFENGILNGGLLAFMLYDTYGFPFDLTQQILKENGIFIDEKDFEKELKKQQERSKQDRKNNEIDIAGNNEIWNDLSLKYQTKKLYYEYDNSIKCEAKVLAIVENGNIVDNASIGSNVYLVLDKSVFYPTGGGEKCDNGIVICNGIVSYVSNVQKEGNLIRIAVEKIKNNISVGNNLLCYSFRKNVGCNHTATHLLQSALRKVLGDKIQQKGSYVDENELRFDFSFDRSLTADELLEVKQLIKSWIDGCFIVDIKEMSKSEAEKLGALHFFGDKYGEVVRVVSILDNDGNLISCEFCGGIHAKNTGELLDFEIETESSIGSGVRRIVARTGILASLAREKQKHKIEIIKLQDKNKEAQKAFENDTNELLLMIKPVVVNDIALFIGKFSSNVASLLQKWFISKYKAVLIVKKSNSNGTECLFASKRNEGYDCVVLTEKLCIAVGGENSEYNKAFYAVCKHNKQDFNYEKFLQEI